MRATVQALDSGLLTEQDGKVINDRRGKAGSQSSPTAQVTHFPPHDEQRVFL